MTEPYYSQSYPPSVWAPPTPPAPDPSITSLAPDTGVAGANVTVVVTGTDFEPTSRIEIEGQEVSTVYVSATELETSGLVPSAPGVYQVTVRNTSGMESNSVPFTVTAVQAQAKDEE